MVTFTLSIAFTGRCDVKLIVLTLSDSVLRSFYTPADIFLQVFQLRLPLALCRSCQGFPPSRLRRTPESKTLSWICRLQGGTGCRRRFPPERPAGRGRCTQAPPPPLGARTCRRATGTPSSAFQGLQRGLFCPRQR